MTSLLLTLEGHRDVPNVSLPVLESSLRQMCAIKGPTYICLQEGDGSFMQAAGTQKRYVIESRDVFGEGFLHWRAATEPDASGVQTEIYYRNKCVEGKHSPRTCPLVVDATEVMGFEQVVEALLHFSRTQTRVSSFVWHDVSASFLKRASGKEIAEIRPRDA